MDKQNKKCPKCGSENVKSIGAGHSSTIAGTADTPLPIVDKWQYVCQNEKCGERFYKRDD